MSRISIPSPSPTIRTLRDDAGTPFAVEVMRVEASGEALRTPPAAEQPQGVLSPHCLTRTFTAAAAAPNDGHESIQIYPYRDRTHAGRVRNGARLRSKQVNAGTTPVARGGWRPRLRWLGCRTPQLVTSPGATP